jgi:transcriptional regulator with XRE-family HTH domain
MSQNVTTNSTRLGSRIRSIRSRSNISQEKLAQWVKTTQPHMSLIEQGKVDVKLPMLIRIAKALRVSIGDLVKF